jgi:hypothetical protein
LKPPSTSASLIASGNSWISAPSSYAAERAEWRVTAQFRAVTATLALRTSEFETNLNIAVEFLPPACGRGVPVPDLDASALTYALLEGIDPLPASASTFAEPTRGFLAVNDRADKTRNRVQRAKD